MKFAADRPFADPEAAARKLVEVAYAFEPLQDGRIDAGDHRSTATAPSFGGGADYLPCRRATFHDSLFVTAPADLHTRQIRKMNLINSLR